MSPYIRCRAEDIGITWDPLDQWILDPPVPPSWPFDRLPVIYIDDWFDTPQPGRPYGKPPEYF